MKTLRERGTLFSSLCFILFVVIAVIIAAYWWFQLEPVNYTAFRSSIFDFNQSQSPVILAWTEFYSYDFVRHLNNSLHNTKCPAKCTITADKRHAGFASAVVFYWNNFQPNLLPQSRHPWQTYVFMEGESPIYSLGPRYFASQFFNLTITYRLDSDIVWAYDRLIPIDEKLPDDATAERWSWREVESAINRKSRMVLQFVSHCDTHSGREIYVSELSEFIDITRYGICSGNLQCKESPCVDRQIEAHKFYLAFENSVCRDYVTEKVWRLKQLIVPIVLRGDDYRHILPNHSYIAVDSFESPRKLAEYLLLLDRNSTEYSRYFQWTKDYFKSDSRIVSGPVCELCKYLHRPNRSAKTVDIDRWWNYENVCEKDFAMRTLENVSVSTRMWHSIKLAYLLMKRRVWTR